MIGNSRFLKQFRLTVFVICVCVCLGMKAIWWNYSYQGTILDMWSIAHAFFGFGLGVGLLNMGSSIVMILFWELFEIIISSPLWIKHASNNILDIVIGAIFAMLGVRLFK